MAKRFIDILLSSVGLLILSPILGLISLMVWMDSPGPILFRQERVGRNFVPFRILKFRTMRITGASHRAGVASAESHRITRIGRWLRKTKLDELPQLLNVLCGQMSIVGPRPEIARFVQAYRSDFEVILHARPGITDLASVRFRDEEAILSEADDPEQFYLARILPDKIQLAKEYLGSQSLSLDAAILIRTLGRILLPSTNGLQ